MLIPSAGLIPYESLSSSFPYTHLRQEWTYQPRMPYLENKLQ
uniref:Uncharacterized protein n=1 Tax=Arundo donax TaxID=35708 RepID=A0A0A9F9T1_ARUDO